MSKMIFFMILFTILIILIFAFVISATKLKDANDKLTKSEKAIEDSLEKKNDLVNKINNQIKKEINKSEFLKDYVNLDSQSLTNIEKDIKLEEAYKLIKNLKGDYEELNNKEFNKLYSELKSNEILLIASKKLYNKYAESSNQIIRKFPNNIVAKFYKYRIRAFFNLKN